MSKERTPLQVLVHRKKVVLKTKDDPRAEDRVAETIVPPGGKEGMNCAAVCRVAPGSKPLVAMNSWNETLVEGGGTNDHVVVYKVGEYEKVQDTKDQLHAEMKILGYRFAQGNQGSNIYIGISKKCCLRCAVVMQMQGTASRGCSGGLWNAGWAIPDFVLNTKLKAFMGDTAYAVYELEQFENNRREFLSTLQTVEGETLDAILNERKKLIKSGEPVLPT